MLRTVRAIEAELIERVLKLASGRTRKRVQRGRPWGDASWVRTTAARLGLGFTLRGPGRPRTRNQ